MIREKVVVGAPIHEYKDYIVRDWLKYVCQELTYSNYEVVVVDNSEDRNWHKQFINLYPNLTVLRYQKAKDKKMTTQQILAECQNKIVTFAKRKGADYLFSSECDNPSEPDVIERLMAHDKLVVGGFYQHGFGNDRYHMIQQVSEPVFGTNLVENRIRLIDFKESFTMIDGRLHMVHGIGIGCVLIDMEIFDVVKFRSDARGEGLSDSYFYYDLTSFEIDVFCDTSINVAHENDSWGWKDVIETHKLSV